MIACWYTPYMWPESPSEGPRAPHVACRTTAVRAFDIDTRMWLSSFLQIPTHCAYWKPIAIQENAPSAPADKPGNNIDFYCAAVDIGDIISADDAVRDNKVIEEDPAPVE